VSSFIGKKLCDHCEIQTEDWNQHRKNIMTHFKNLVGKYEFANKIPSGELGIGILAIMSYLIKIQSALTQVVVMIDMIREESFGEIFSVSMNAISTKTHQELVALKNLTQQRLDDPASSLNSFNAILRLEREIDEDNIVICRQISTLSVEGETNYSCFIMRKIVGELEHISDYIKEAAEIIIEI